MAQINNYEPIEVRTNDGWVIVVRPVPWNDYQEIWIGQNINGKMYQFSVDKNGDLESKVVENGQEATPILRIPRNVWWSLAEAIRGVLPEPEPQKNELTATKYHLEDMRKLVFMKKQT